MFKWLFGENEDDKLTREIDEFLNRPPSTVYFEIQPYKSQGFIIVMKSTKDIYGLYNYHLCHDNDLMIDGFFKIYRARDFNLKLNIFPTKIAAEKALKPYLEKAKTDNERKLKEHRDEARHKENNPVATYIP